MALKNFTVKMKKVLTKKLLDINLEEWGFSKNTNEFIELVNRNTNEKKKILKEEYGINEF